MAHAKSLRVIGQSLEVARAAAFELENDGQSYVLRSDSLTQTGEWILQNALSENEFSERRTRPPTIKRSLRFSPPDISRLDAEGQKRRRNQTSSRMESSKLSQLLRTLGDHLDRTPQAPFIFLGRLIPFLSITREQTVRVTQERLLRKNCSKLGCIRDSDGPAAPERFQLNTGEWLAEF